MNEPTAATLPTSAIRMPPIITDKRTQSYVRLDCVSFPFLSSIFNINIYFFNTGISIFIMSKAYEYCKITVLMLILLHKHANIAMTGTSV